MGRMIVDLAIATVSYPHPRCQEGDIRGERPCADYIGLLEGYDILWIRADVDEELAGRLDEPGNGRKRRYQIPLLAIATVIPGFNIVRARDPREYYQPILDTDSRTGISRRVPFWTKVTSTIVNGIPRQYVETSETIEQKKARWKSHSIRIDDLLIDHGPAVEL